MKKRETSLLALVLTAALAISGCGGQPAASTGEAESAGALTLQAAEVKNEMIAPTREEVADAYKRAVTAFGWFHKATLPCGETSILVDGELYQQVEKPGIATMAQLETYLRGLFSKQIVEQLLDRGSELPLYRDIDGVLYGRDFLRENDPYKGEVDIVVEQEEPEACMVNVTVELLDDDGDVAGLEYYSFPYRYVEGRWVFTDFRLVDILR